MKKNIKVKDLQLKIHPIRAGNPLEFDLATEEDSSLTKQAEKGIFK